MYVWCVIAHDQILQCSQSFLPEFAKRSSHGQLAEYTSDQQKRGRSVGRHQVDGCISFSGCQYLVYQQQMSQVVHTKNIKLTHTGKLVK